MMSSQPPEPGAAPSETPSAAAASRGLRWWPAALIVLALTAGEGYLWLVPQRDLSQRNLMTQILAILAGLLLVVWLLLFSRLAGRLRLKLAAGTAVLAVLAAATLRFNGLTGGLWFDVRWRWAAKPAVPAAVALPVGQPGGTADLAHPTDHDYPQFLGPQRIATVEGYNWAGGDEPRPPEEVWRRPMGKGWSSFAVVGDYAVTQEQRGERELVSCFELKTGREVWTSIDAETPAYASVLAGDGPRATPTVAPDGRVYATGVTGRLRCLDGQDGRPLWAANVLADCQGRMHQWGEAVSPLVVDDLVITTAGLAAEGQSPDDHLCLVAYDRQTGERRWATPGDAADYSSPVLVELAGKRQVLLVSKRLVAGYHPADGRRLWTFEWRNPEGNIADPMVCGPGKVLVSSGYGWGSALFEVKATSAGFETLERWRNKNLKAKFANFVVYQGHAFGLDDGILTCLEIESGRRTWKRGRYGHGQMMRLGSLLLIQAETGELVLVAADPGEPRELATFTALSGKTWNNPALAAPYLLLRNDQQAVCFRCPLEPSPAASTAGAR